MKQKNKDEIELSVGINELNKSGEYYPLFWH